MTREEHIENLKAIASDMPSDKCADWIESLMAGVKALEQEPCVDVISRQAVLEGLASIAKIKAKSDAQKSLMGRVMFFVKELPPVTPQPKMGLWIKTPKAVMGEGYMWYCDKCEHKVYQDSSKPYPSEKYCPNCGQPKMQEGEG